MDATPIGVLLIEDNRGDARLIRELLREVSGEEFRLEWVDRLAAGMTRLAVDHVDVVLLDLSLPDSQGLETFIQLQRQVPSLPIVVLTGLDNETMAIHAVQHGAQDYLVKGQTDSNLLGRSLRYAIERKRALESLRESEQRFQAFMNNSPALAFMKDEEGRYVYANQAIDHLFQRDQRGKTDLDLWPEDLARQIQENDRSVLASGKSVELIERMPTPDGVLRDWLVFKFPFRSASGRLFLGGMAVDITARKRMQEHEAQLRLAGKIQRRLCPSTAPALPGFDLAGVWHPAESTSGDYYDYIPMGNDRLGIVIGDVCGHGFGPSLLMAETRAYLRALALTRTDVGEILTLTNRILAADTVDDRYVTLFFGQLDLATRSFEYGSAGHPAAYLFDDTGQVKAALPSTSPPLGIEISFQFAKAATLQLEPGELVLLLTDGVVEAASPEGRVLGVDPLLKVVRENRRRTAGEILDLLHGTVCKFCRGTPQLDDMTMVLIRVEGPDLVLSP